MGTDSRQIDRARADAGRGARDGWGGTQRSRCGRRGSRPNALLASHRGLTCPSHGRAGRGKG
eukprot:11189644-Lingulodinium_polyedra.AAC.1